MYPLLGNRRCHGNHFVLHSLGVFLMLASKYEFDTTTQYWVITILTGYVTLRCDLDLWPFDFGVMSRDDTLVFEPCAKFELDTIYRSRYWTTTIFHWSPKVAIFTFFGVKGSNFKFNLYSPQNALPWRKRRIMTYWALGCVQKCDLWACQSKEKRTDTFMRQTGYLPRLPTLT